MSFWKKTMDYLGLGPDDATTTITTGQAEGEAVRQRALVPWPQDASGIGGKTWPARSDETAIRQCPRLDQASRP